MSYYRKLYSCDELPSRAKLVYIYLYDRCDKENKAWPSVKTIARELSISDKTVRRAVKDLEKAGLVRKEYKKRANLLVKSLRNRLRVISMAEEKTTRIDEIINHISEKDHFVVYCGDGKLFDTDSGKELRHIQSVKRTLTAHGYKASQFTATENMADRMELVDAFNKQEISALAAIRCLDEGINIPSIKSALILSSNDDYREFVQRRGRILRTYGNKQYANIYDVIVLPSHDMQGWAKIELRRFHEYARLALNWQTVETELYSLLETYGLTIEDVDVYDYEGMEEMLDE